MLCGCQRRFESPAFSRSGHSPSNPARKPTTADLTGHPVGHAAEAIWELFIADPSQEQLLPAARAAAAHGLREVVALAERLQRMGWTAQGGDKQTGRPSRITSADSRCALIRLNGDAGTPGV